jgi:uncharacterized phiE125 gp8 family phage protein
MTTIVITAPTEEPVTLAEAKVHCKATDFTDDDALISSLIIAARQQAEHRTGRSLCTQTLELVLDEFPDGFKLIKPPVSAVVSVKYIDTAGVQQTLNSANYSLDNNSEPAWLVPAYGLEWPLTLAVPNAVRVRYTAGYGAAAAVPDTAKTWIKVAISTMYSQREGIIDGRFGEVPRDFFAALLDPLWIPVL